MSILTSPRFSFEPPPTGTEALHRVRAAWISDVHLGTRTSNAEALLQFLREYDCEKLYVVGDLIDIWQLRRGCYWPQQHNDVIQKILRKARKGVPVVYIPGNHDEFVSTYGGAYGNISIQEHAIHTTVDAVLCGHIHSAAVHQFTGVTYYNCGDWVESCTAMVEQRDGRIELVSYPPLAAPRSVKTAVPEGVLT